jgi:pimeloyl-ACP methyl ester carboxylesterase
MIRTSTTLCILILACVACAHPEPRVPRSTPHAEQNASTSPPEAIDPEATNYTYPYPVQFFGLNSQLQGLRMAYIDAPAAAPNGRTVVLLHGKNFSAAAWATTIGALSAQGFRVIAPDQIGFGKSSKPVRYQFSFGQLALNTHELLDALKIEKPIIVGHSMGGMLAVRYALEHGPQIERLVLVNPIGLEDYRALVPYRSIDAWYADELKQTPDTLREYQRKAYYDGAWDPAYEEHIRLPSGWTKHPDYPRVAWNSALLYDMIFSQPVVHDFPRIESATCLIIGTRDKTALGRNFAAPEVAARMGNYAELGKRTRDAIPGSRLIELDGLGHVPQIEAFERFRAALFDCLQ